MYEGDTPFWYAVFRGCLDGTQYAKGRYAVRKNPVISYAVIKFCFETVLFFIKKYNERDVLIQITLKQFARSLRLRLFSLFQHL